MPSNTHQGTVVRIDRANNLVDAALTSGERILAAYFSKGPRTPWPLCTATFQQSHGSWLCTGPIGDRREILREDFTIVPTVTGTGAGAVVACDTPWTAVSGSLASAVSQNNFAGGDGAGVARLAYAAAAGGTALTLRKDIGCLAVPVAPMAAHFAARVAVGSLATPQSYLTAGFFFSTGSDAAFMIIGDFTVGGALALFATQPNGAGRAQAAQGTTPVANTWYWIDIIMTNSFCAGWIEGDGPYVNTTNLPTADLSISLQAVVENKDADYNVYADCVKVALCPVQDGTQFAVDA